jgi:hypothetical protein
VKKRNLFLTFFLIVSVLTASALLFIQSKVFAHIFKGVVARYLPRDMGVDADFSEFAIKIYPPGLSLKNPSIKLLDHNALKMPAGSTVQAERIDLNFRPLQMLTGTIRVHELVIDGGQLHLFVQSQPEQKAKKKSLTQVLPAFHWDELFQVRAEAVVIQNSAAKLEWLESKKTAEFQIASLKLGQWMGRGGLGYVFDADINGVGGNVFDDIPLLQNFEKAQFTAHFNALGVQLDQLHLKAKGIELKGNGMIRGNLQKPKDGLNLDADLTADADIGSLASALGSKTEASGSASFSGRVRGNLLKALQTLNLEGEFSAKDFQYRKFHADELHASGVWISSPQGGEVDLEKGLILARESPRMPGKPAIGGKIELGALKLKLGSSEPVNFNVNLDRADIQWLAAIGLSDLKPVFPLDFKASGPIEATISPPGPKSPLLVKAQLKLKIDDLLLDNQKLTEIKPEHRIFKVPSLSLQGPLVVDADGIHPDGMSLELPHTKLKLSGGLHFKSGFDLHGDGAANLADLGEVAENPIRGEGQVAVHVHGPAKKLLIDIDTNLKNAYYIHLDLGDIKGRITWDDDPNHLLLQKMSAVKGVTEYGVDGMLDLGKVNTVSLKANITKGNIQDFTQIFGELTKDLWWFPQSLSGPFTGDLTVSGGLDLKELQVLGRLNGNSWDYFGERFSKVSMLGGYSRGKYFISDFQTAKRKGKISGRLEYDDSLFDWDIHTSQFTVSDIDHIAQLDVPIRGKIQIDSTGKGKLGNIVSESKALLTDLSVRGSSMPPSQIHLSSAGGIHRLRGTFLGSEGKLDATYDFNPTRMSKISADFKHLDFSPILLLLNPKGITDSALTGYASGSAHLAFRSGQIERADGDVSIDEYFLSKRGTRFQLESPVSFKVSDGTFDLKDLRVQGSGLNPPRTSEAVMNLRSRQADLDGTIQGDVDASIAEFFT